MSLIEEALRRVQDPVIAEPKTRRPNARTPESSENPSAHSWPIEPTAPFANRIYTQSFNALVAVAVTVILLAAVLVIWGSFWLGHTLGGTRPGIAVGPLQPAPVPSPEPATTPAPRENDQLILTGVVEGIGEPYAVINGKILAVGEQIGGATLLEIADGTVKLRRADGGETVLRVAR